MNPQIIIAAVIAALGFAGGWQIQSWRYGSKENERAKQELANIQQSAAADIRRLDNVIVAQNEAAALEQRLRVDAASSRSALVGMSDATARALRTAQTSHEACLNRAAALGDVLTELGRAGGELAEKAGRHTKDIRTLMDSWPQ